MPIEVSLILGFTEAQDTDQNEVALDVDSDA